MLLISISDWIILNFLLSSYAIDSSELIAQNVSTVCVVPFYLISV